MYRSNLEFRHSFPDDMIEEEGEDGDILQFPGLGMAEAIAAKLTSLGYHVAEPVSASELGWELKITGKGGKGRRLWLRINPFSEEEGYLYASDVNWQFWRTEPTFWRFLSQLNDLLRADERFQIVGWFPSEDDGLRTPRPVPRDGV